MDVPNGASKENWDRARSILSLGFTIPIGDKVADVIELARNIDNLESYDFKFVTWHEFVDASDRPEGLMERALNWSPETTDFVVYDPLDNEDGFMLLSWNPLALAKEACDYIIQSEPEEGPLSVDNIVMSQVENA